jgi:hypothetical protein
MTTAQHQIQTFEPNASALAFLRSEFAGDTYMRWSIERRLEVYLRHQGLDRVADDGRRFEELLQRVMANFSRARRDGLLSPPPRRQTL